MNFNSIEEYFAKFPDDIKSINVSMQTHYLPDLSRFYKLIDLVCSNNQLTQLPTLPPTLINLYCINNRFTQLPTLPPTLTHLYCSNNELTQLPTLPSTLEFLDCRYNLLPFDHEINNINMMMEYIIEMRNKNNIFIRFKELFYAVKYKKQFRHWLWVHIREPKIRIKYHPDNLIIWLEGPENLRLDELDELDNNW